MKLAIFSVMLIGPFLAALAIVLDGKPSEYWRYPAAMSVVVLAAPLWVLTAYLLDKWPS